MTPDGWRRTSLGEIASLITKGESIQWQGADYVPSGVPFLRTVNVRDGFLDLDGLKFVAQEVHSRMRRSQLSPGDLLISIAGTLGRACLLPATIRNANINQDLALVRFSRPDIAVSFVLHTILGPEIQAQIDLISQGGTRNHLNLQQTGRLEFGLPPLPEQCKIAAILSSVDEVIEGTQAVIDQLQVVKKAMMADLLTRGIPGRHKTFKQTEIGEVPVEWEIRPFADICSAIVDGVHKKPDYVREGIPFVTIKNLTAVEEGISFEDLNYISAEDHAQFTKRTRPERGDILLTKDGTLGIPRVVDTDRAFSIFVSVAVMKPIRSLIDSWFMRFALEAPAIAAHFGVVNAGMALKHIHLVDLRATPCPVPDRKSVV